MQMLCLKGSPGRRCLFISYTGLLWIVLQASVSKGNIQDKYIGCYYDDVNDQSQPQKTTLQNNTTLTIEWCVGQCLLQSSTYAGLENSKACRCGEDFGVSSQDTSCNSLCPGNQSEYCGGSNGKRAFYSIYAVCKIGYYGSMCDQVCHCKGQAPCNRMTGKCPKECEEKWSGTTCSDIFVSQRYIGCFRDNNTVRAISQDYTCGNQQLTVESCSNTCTVKNNSIAGLQAGYCCFCGESYARYGPLNESSCSDPCIGNSSQRCGGLLATSVYSVCPAGYYGPKCHNQCRCYNNSRCVYLTGECNSTCKAGWTGNSCNIRDCQTENGDCSQNETCATINLNFATITGCRCFQGFERNAFWETCGVMSSDPFYGVQRSLSGNLGQVYSVGVVVGAAVGSAVGAAAIFAIIFIVIIVCRRQRMEREQCEVANQIQHKDGTYETPRDPMPWRDYEILEENPNQIDSSYTALDQLEHQ